MKIIMIAAFDFDNTIIPVNSDTYINKLVKSRRELSDLGQIYPHHVEEIGDINGWTARMQAVFDFMHKEYNITEKDFTECLNEIEIEESMKKLLRALKEKDYRLVIISDANTIFIETILRQNGLADLFDMNKSIYTNKAFFDQNGRLNVLPFNQSYNQEKQTFNCETNMCAKNICKGTVFLELLLMHEGADTRHIYVGDGLNDFCPGTFLNPGDSFFVKKNFSLYRHLQRSDLSEKLKCKIVYWSDAQEILDSLSC